MVQHNRPDLDSAIAQIRLAFEQHQIRDGVVAIERTGRYHRIVQRDFGAAGFETRILHPFVTKQYRQPVDPGNKTDDADLAAIHRATVTACALLEATHDEAWTTLHWSSAIAATWSARAPPSTVRFATTSKPAVPGYAACFETLPHEKRAEQNRRDYGSSH